MRPLFLLGNNTSFLFLFVCALSAACSLQAQTSRPNIVIYLLDDANESLLEYPGTNYPSINRIANEGIKFRDAYVTTSKCNPSRYSIYTGMYAHTHGATENTFLPRPDLPTFFSILASAGYHCAAVGKYSNMEAKVIPGMEKTLTLKTINQKSPTMWANGVKKIFTGINATTLIADTATSWLASLDTPFVLLVGHIGTHTPLSIVSAYAHTYDGLISLPDNYHKYTDDYPSFMYTDPGDYSTSGKAMKIIMEKHLEIVQEIDRGVGNDMAVLMSRGILNNTMIVYTNDNGYFYGEHKFKGKQDAREPVSGVPLYIRYPLWFTAGTFIADNYVALFDLCPTFLEVAGIDPLPYGFQSTSIQTLLEPGKKRKSVYLEAIIPFNPDKPSWRAVRKVGYKYIRYHCDSLVEEMFDLTADPAENQNVIRNTAYQNTAAQLRSLLDSLTISESDTLSWDTVFLPCTLIDALNRIEESYELLDETGEVLLYPNPASDYLEVYIPGNNPESDFILIDIFDFSGRRVYHLNTTPENFKLKLDVSKLPVGIYMVHALDKDVRFEIVR